MLCSGLPRGRLLAPLNTAAERDTSALQQAVQAPSRRLRTRAARAELQSGGGGEKSTGSPPTGSEAVPAERQPLTLSDLQTALLPLSEGLNTLSAEFAAQRSGLAAQRSDLAALRSETSAEFAALRSDLAEQRSDLAEQRSETSAEFAALRSETSAEFAALRNDLAEQRSETSAEFAALRSDLAEQRSDLAEQRSDLAALRRVTSATSENVAALVELAAGVAAEWSEWTRGRVSSLGELCALLLAHEKDENESSAVVVPLFCASLAPEVRAPLPGVRGVPSRDACPSPPLAGVVLSAPRDGQAARVVSSAAAVWHGGGAALRFHTPPAAAAVRRRAGLVEPAAAGTAV
jgi:septal ring factor EnvC (AmiA/AmiB activator)